MLVRRLNRYLAAASRSCALVAGREENRHDRGDRNEEP